MIPHPPLPTSLEKYLNRIFILFELNESAADTSKYDACILKYFELASNHLCVEIVFSMSRLCA
jgi:hypothetical protein